MACHECKFSIEDDCNPNNFVCHCKDARAHYLHILHANHSCIKYKFIRADKKTNGNRVKEKKK